LCRGALRLQTVCVAEGPLLPRCASYPISLGRAVTTRATKELTRVTYIPTFRTQRQRSKQIGSVSKAGCIRFYNRTRQRGAQSPGLSVKPPSPPSVHILLATPLSSPPAGPSPRPLRPTTRMSPSPKSSLNRKRTHVGTRRTRDRHGACLRCLLPVGFDADTTSSGSGGGTPAFQTLTFCLMWAGFGLGVETAPSAP
jgi:hypothetical protein